MSTAPSAEAVQKILETARTSSDRPTDASLGPCYSFLIPSTPSTSASGSSSTHVSSKTHWFCSRALSQTHREAAGYLLFLFAFKRQGTSKIWVDTLEDVLRSCEECSRGFGIARREFGPLYMSHYPLTNRINFFRTIDTWQSQFILNTGGISALSTPFTQLLMAEPSLLEVEAVNTLIDNSIAKDPSTPLSNIAALGVTPLLVRLMRSTVLDRRKWAFIQVQAAARKKLSLDELIKTGVRDEIEDLCNDPALEGKEKWKMVKTMLKKGCFEQEAVEKGLLGGHNGSKSRKGKGIMSTMVSLLGAENDFFPALLEVFALLLHVSPTRSFWTFDPSPELPHALFSDIKANPSFQAILDERYQKGSSMSMPISLTSTGDADLGKGKGQASVDLDPLAWISDFLSTLVSSKSDTETTEIATGFPEAVARVMGDCLQEYQHNRFTAGLRAATAQAGIEALSVLVQRPDRIEGADGIALASTLSIHSKFIAAVAFRSQDHPAPTWTSARTAAHDVLTRYFRMDGKDIVESVLGISLIAQEERKRQLRAKKAVQKGLPVPPPIPVNRLHMVRVQKDLWSAAYNTLSPVDAVGTAIMVRAIASFAHIEKLNRDETWNHAELQLENVVKEEDWVAAIRAINQGIVASRDSFAQAIESLAIQPDQNVLKKFWNQPDIARDVVVLLLSPAEDVHDPTISLIQQSFENVDDRADCFRVLLTQYPAQTVDGLCNFLASFIDTARITPESCSLAKWLVRCFTDVLEALCSASEEGGEPLLQQSAFTTVYFEGQPMRKRILYLWHLMTTALAVILKRTIDWAPLYDNETMVDWMRDALIFGRQMADNIRAFEAATLHASVQQSKLDNDGKSPARTTHTGAKLVQKLEIVLRDLVSWLRLTDLETLHQTFELIKTIVGRIAKTNPDVSRQPELELCLLELEKFSRKASRSYRTRLSDDLLSEISGLLEPFNLVIADDEVQYVKTALAEEALAAPTRIASPAVLSPAPPKPVLKPKNAFEEMMRRAGGATSTSKPSQPRSSPSSSVAPKSDPAEIIEINDDDEFDDGFLDNFSAAELDRLEKKSAQTAKPVASASSTIQRKPLAGQPQLKLPMKSSTSASAASKLNINVVPKPPPPKATGFKSSFMRELQREHRADRAAQFQRDRIIGGVVPKLPPASGLGSGLGVYQGPRRTVQPVDSGSSASDSSEDERRGAAAIVARKKEPKKIERLAVPLSERRPIKVLDSDVSDMMRKREEQRARQYALKMRLKPDLNGLYRFVLSWDPTHSGQSPPHHPSLVKDLGSVVTVPTTFSSVESYRRVMLPLFLQELWMQCLKDDIRTMPLSVEISSRAYEDDFLDMELTVQGQLPNDFYVNESDIIILKTPARSVLAKVQGFKRKFKDSAMKVRILNIVDDSRLLSVKSRWQLQKHVSLSTALREYGALQGLPYYEAPLLNNILNARSARMPILSSSEVEDAKDAFSVNEPQARAILGAMSIEGFALIQGPPGTGKTKTISGLVGKFLSDRGSFIPVNGEKPVKQKLLVCAPSNAAIDEVCKRLMHGVPSAHGGRHTPNIVRIGIESSVNIAVKPVALEALVEARVASTGAGAGGNTDYSRIQAELEEVKKNITVKQEELRAAQGNDEKYQQIEKAIFALVQKRTQLGQKSSKAKDAARDATRHLEGARRAAKDAIMHEADIICATLSGAGHESLSPYSFETVIIDEAAQAIEMSCLIPLKYSCKRCIMVGDPNQLPPTTFSSDAERLHYNESLFVRMVKQNASNVQLLSIQYRMHPYISELPSKVFYNGQLKDGDGMEVKTRAIWHEKSIFGPYRFFNVEGLESKQGTSTKNVKEALTAVDLVQRLHSEFEGRVNFDTRIGIISMYKEQLWELKNQFIRAFGTGILDRIEFNTVDGFQGQEKDIIILSCVRSGPNLQTIGFLRDPRRMNVALTRAKSSLFIIGNGPTLERSDERWKTIVGDARERGFFANYDASLFAKKYESLPEQPKKKIKKEPGDSKDVIPIKTAPSPVKPAMAKAVPPTPPKSIMDEAKPLKRKASQEIKKEEKTDVKREGEDEEAERRRRKKEKKEKKEKKRKLESDESTRDSSPASTISDQDRIKPKTHIAPSNLSNGSLSNPSGRIDEKPRVNGSGPPAGATHADMVNRPPRPPNGPPPALPPPPPAHSHGVPPIPGPKQITKPSAGSAALFHQKKKKKPIPPPGGPRPPGPPVRQMINDNLKKR